MNGLNLFYDRKTTRMYCALSDLDQDNKKDSTTFNDIRPCIGELPTLDTMLTIQNYIFPENLPTKYSINADASQIVGFSSSGYMLCDYAEGSKIPKGITTFNLREIRFANSSLRMPKILTSLRIRSPGFKPFIGIRIKTE